MNIFTRLFLKVAVGAAFMVLVAALWMRGERYAEQAHAREVQLKGAIAISNANAALTQIHADLARKIDASATVAAVRKQDLRLQSNLTRKAINDAPMDEDGPLAAVLRDQLDRLPERPDAGSAGRPAAALAAGGAVAAK